MIKKKLLLITSIFLFVVMCITAQQDTMKLSIVLATGSSGSACGDTTDCDMNRLCFNIIGEPTSGIIGYQVASYDIWLSTTSGQSSPPPVMPISSETTCNANNASDLPGNPSNVRVGANDVGGNPVDFVSGPNIIHNFCITYNDLSELNGAVTGATPTLPGGSSMAASINGSASTTINVFLTEAFLQLDSSLISCLLPPDNIPIIEGVDCPDVVDLSNTTLTQNGRYKAQQFVRSANLLALNTNMRFEAKDSVLLLPGFEVNSPTVFEVRMQDCIVD